MKWRCAECDRVYDEPPERCVCGSPNIAPAEDEPSRYSLSALRDRLLDPEHSDRSLVREEPYVAVAFRIILVLALVGIVVLAVQAVV